MREFYYWPRTIKTDIIRFIECWHHTLCRPDSILDSLTGRLEGDSKQARDVWEDIQIVASQLLDEKVVNECSDR